MTRYILSCLLNANYKTTPAKEVAVTMIRIYDGSFAGESDGFVPWSFRLAVNVDVDVVCAGSVDSELFGDTCYSF